MDNLEQGMTWKVSSSCIQLINNGTTSSSVNDVCYVQNGIQAPPTLLLRYAALAEETHLLIISEEYSSFVFVWNKFTGWWPALIGIPVDHHHGGQSPTCCWHELLRAAINISSSRGFATRNPQPTTTIITALIPYFICITRHADPRIITYTANNHSTASNNSRNGPSLLQSSHCCCSVIVILWPFAELLLFDDVWPLRGRKSRAKLNL